MTAFLLVAHSNQSNPETSIMHLVEWDDNKHSHYNLDDYRATFTRMESYGANTFYLQKVRTYSTIQKDYVNEAL